jgi:hypothetical protein
MKKISIAWFFMLVTLVSFTRIAYGEPKERMWIPAKEGKKPKFTKNFDYGVVRLRRLVFEGENVDKWTESLEIIIGQRSAYSSTVSKVYNEMMEKRKLDCPDMTCRIIEQKPDSILYEIQANNCGDYPAEYSVTRIVFSRNYVHFAIYNNRQPDLADKVRTDWIDRLSNVKIISQP